MQMRDKDTAYFFELETSLHKKEIRSRADLTSELLADTFIEFGSSGKVWNKSSIVASMRGEESDSQITVEDFAVRELAPEVVLVTYTSKKVAQDQAVASTLRSSIWKHVDGKWQMIFHQGTRTWRVRCPFVGKPEVIPPTVSGLPQTLFEASRGPLSQLPALIYTCWFRKRRRRR